jgi:putative peptidoglycan lipid II flippase
LFDSRDLKKNRIIDLLPKGALLLSLISILNVVVGFSREATVAYFFGTSQRLDTFLVALTLPQLLASNLAEISVAVVLPIYVGLRQAQRLEEATALVQKWFLFSGAVVAGACAVLFVLADAVMYALAPGFDAARRAEAATWLRTLLPYVWLLGVSGVFKSVLNSHERFFVPAFSGQLVSLCVIFFCALLSQRWGAGALAAGFVSGAMLGFLWQLLNARRFEPRLPARKVAVRGVALPIAAGGAMVLHAVAYQVDTIVDRAFASGLPAGSIAAYNYALMINSIPSTIVSAAISTALFPVLARMTAGGDWQGALRTVRRWSLGLCSLGIVPVILLVIFREQVVTLVFQRGAFTERGVAMTASVLNLLPFLILLSFVSTLFTQLLLAKKMARYIALLSVFTLCAKVGCNIVFVRQFGLWGLALSTVIVASAATALRIYFSVRRAPA